MKNKEYVEISYTYPSGFSETRLVKLENLRKALNYVRNQKI